MPIFLTTNSISEAIGQTIVNARWELYLLMPRLRMSPQMILWLGSADRRGVKSSIIYRENHLDEETLQDLQQLPRLRIYYCENLNANGCLNEQQLVLTSMDFAAGEENKVDWGVLLTRREDSEAYIAGFNEVNPIIKQARLQDLSVELEGNVAQPQAHATISVTPVNSQSAQQGACIRCGVDVKYEAERPFCIDCFSDWVQSGDPFAEQQFCHSCGAATPDICMDEPLCGVCRESLSS